MANRYDFRNDTEITTYDPIEHGHKTFLLHLASCIRPQDRTQFNTHVLKQGYNYKDEELIDFWLKLNVLEQQKEY